MKAETSFRLAPPPGKKGRRQKLARANKIESYNPAPSCDVAIEVACTDGALRIVTEGRHKKFLNRIDQVSYSAPAPGYLNDPSRYGSALTPA
jgi:hypothetical protein